VFKKVRAKALSACSDIVVCVEGDFNGQGCVLCRNIKDGSKVDGKIKMKERKKEAEKASVPLSTKASDVKNLVFSYFGRSEEDHAKGEPSSPSKRAFTPCAEGSSSNDKKKKSE